MMMSKILALVCADVLANFFVYVLFEDYNSLVIGVLKFSGILGILDSNLGWKLVYIYISCLTSLMRTVNFLQVFHVYLLCLNIYSSLVSYVFLVSTVQETILETEEGIRQDITK